MPSENIKNTGLKRRQAVAELLLGHFRKNPNISRIHITEDDLNKHPLLKDLKTFEVSLERIHEELKSDFTYSIHRNNTGRLAEMGVLRKNYFRVEIVVDDWDKMLTHLETLKKVELELGKIAITIDFNRGIFPTDNRDKIYQISRMPKKVLELIAKRKVVSQKVIMSFAGYEHPSQVRNLVDDINMRIGKLFKNPSDENTEVPIELIKHNKTLGGHYLDNEGFAITLVNLE